MIAAMSSADSHKKSTPSKPRPSAPIAFEPDLGQDARVYRRLVRAAEAGAESLKAALSIELARSKNPATKFALHVLRDILQLGGIVWVRDSRLLVAWPNWSGPTGRLNARKALAAARDDEVRSTVDPRRIAPLFLSSINGPNLLRLVREGQFELVTAKDNHPSGIPYGEGFTAALRYWSMPYRGRTGRMARFILTVRHETIAPNPVIVGILELGDEAPFCTWRDNLIGLSTEATLHWLSHETANRSTIAATRLRRIRRALKPLESGQNLSKVPALEIINAEKAYLKLAAGRSSVDDSEVDLLDDRRRAIYGLRLAYGEAALDRVSDGEPVEGVTRRWLINGIRALRDLLVPRLHMEVTVCGAIPPFSQVLGGKLIVAQFAHPYIIDAAQTPLGELISRTFELEAISAEITSPGMIATTTKGLYSGHSPLYNRSLIPGDSAPISLRKIAETRGHTSTLLSKATAAAAKQLAAASADHRERRVSQLYGSGGAKRHRMLETAAQQIGLSKDLINAGIRRPVYGAVYVTNAVEVAWENAKPAWVIRRDDRPSEYMQRAVEAWRNRWLPKAATRLSDSITFPGSLAMMLESNESDTA